MKSLVIAHVNLAKGFRGGERQTELLISRLANLGAKQIFVCRKGSPLVNHLETVPELEIIELEGAFDLRLEGHCLLGKRCDIVQAHEARATQWAYIHSFLFGTAYVTTRRVPERVRDNFLNRSIYARASAVVAISRSIADSLKSQFGRSIELIPSSCAHFEVNQERVSSLKQRFADCFVVGHIGALVDKHKGQSTLIAAVRRLVRNIPNLKVVFLGAGPDENLLKKQAGELVDQGVVIFEGFVPNVGDYIRAMDVFAYPSNYEGLGSVLLDVMEQGIPIVASAVDGIPDIVKHNTTGLLVDKGDASAIEKAIQSIKDVPGLREKLVGGARRMALEHSPEKMAEAYSSLYRRILVESLGHQ